MNKGGVWVVFTLVLISFLGCEKPVKTQPIPITKNIYFRDIQGIADDEIKAIEALQKKYDSFTYGMLLSTEAFIGKNGEIQGYAPLFCDWLTNMFGIPFKIEFYELDDLQNKLESGDVNFTGELMITPERRKTYFMTSSIAERSLEIYRIKDSEPLDTIIKSRLPRYAFLKESVLSFDVAENVEYNFKTYYVEDCNIAYRMLKNGEIDAYLGMNTSDAAFKEFNDVVTEDFYPLIYKSASLSTRQEELAPIINIVEKTLDEQTLSFLARLYNEGHQQYLKEKIYNMFTDEEKAYIQNNPVIQIAAEFDNYPVCFFDDNTKRLHGIYLDTLDEITQLTGLEFVYANDHYVNDKDLIEMLEKGEALIMPELFRLKEYENRFLWAENPLLTDSYAFLSKSYFQNIELSQIPYLKIAVRSNSIYSEFFKRMFPHHRHLYEYETQEEVWNALKNDEVEIIFACSRRLITYTNFYEEAGYKLNLILNYTFDSSFGYNKDAANLKSIIDKSLSIININNISNQWMHKSYDYRYKLAEAQRPWLTGLSVMFFFILIMVSFFLIKSHNVGKHLETIVKDRTSELSYKTSQLQLILDSIPDLMFCKNNDLRYTQCNKHFLNFAGVSEAEVIGKTDEEGAWLSPESMAYISKTEQTVLKESKMIQLEEQVSSVVTGKDMYFETAKAPLIQDGVVVGIMGIARDITKRKEMEKAIAYQTSLLKTIIDSIPDCVFCKDENYKYTLCNKYMTNVFGRKFEDIIGKNDIDALGLSPENAAITNNIDRKVINEQQKMTFEEWVNCADGVKRLFETVKVPLIFDGKIVGILGIGRDITQRKAMENEIIAASRAKSDFLANMSHEIRTPLNVIIGLTDLTLEDDHLDNHVIENLTKITNAGTTLLSIVNDILDFSKIESGKLNIAPIEYYMSSLLNDVITLVITRLGEKPITFSLNISDDLPIKLYGDDLRVKQILTNLLTNSVKYTNRGKIELTVKCVREGSIMWMYISVSDTGIGIREDDLQKLFLDYYQVDAKANRNIEGTGLGLPITKRLVDLMHGEIHAESEFGKGTTFSLRIRQGFVDEHTIGHDLAEKLRNFHYAENKRIITKRLVRPDLSYARVLVVDDMQTNLDVASGLLRKYKMQVDCLNSGREAINRIILGTPVYDAVFMDHMMPGMDGIEAADNIRALNTPYAKNIPIIALTANAIQGTEKMFFEHGFQAFITKPIDVMEMDSVIRKWVRDESKEKEHSPPPQETSASSEIYDSSNDNIEINIPGVDTKKGLSLYGGETDIYLPLLHSYVSNTPVTLSKIKSVTKENLHEYVIAVHGLKGTSAGIGAKEIQESAMELETISRAGDLDGVLSKNDKLIKDTEIVVANIKSWLTQYDKLNAKPRLKAPDRVLLANLKQFCENYNMSGIDQTISELDKYDYDEGADLITWLKEKISISEMTEIVTRLAKEGIN